MDNNQGNNRPVHTKKYMDRKAAAARAKKARERKIRRTITVTILILIFVLIIALICKGCKAKSSKKEEPKNTEPETSQVDPNKVVATAKVSSVGDILIHEKILKASNTSGDYYDFTRHFASIKQVISTADLAVANLEVTIAEDNFSAYPRFRTPEAIISALKDCGFDFLVTANNHCYDGRFDGIKRTASKVREAGLGQTGTYADLSQKRYEVVDVNGIKIGIVNYTYETVRTEPGQKSMNGVVVTAEAGQYINSFDYDNLDAFYTEMQENVTNMKKDGAEAIMLYIHWGTEYKLKQNNQQETIAQKMCDLGVDVIIGGHPHVIQPAAVLTNETGTHKTFCIYSTGNFISNQRKRMMRLDTGNTEDGIIVNTTFEKYGDGRVELKSVDYIPTWVNETTVDGKKTWLVTPLDDMSKVTSNTSDASASKERTISLVDEGFKSFAG